MVVWGSFWKTGLEFAAPVLQTVFNDLFPFLLKVTIPPQMATTEKQTEIESVGEGMETLKHFCAVRGNKKIVQLLSKTLGQFIKILK